MTRRRSMVVPILVTALVAALAGWLAGRASIVPPVPVPPTVTLVSCDEPRVVTPPVAAVTPPRRAQPPKPVPAQSPLPDLANREEDRERLLAFVRERADSLKDCAGASSERVRLTLRLDVAGKGTVKKVDVLDEDPAHKQAGGCVAARMRTWLLPEEWVRADRTLLVSVVL